MFIYEVKTTNSLASHISVSGQYLTFWLRGDYSPKIAIFTEVVNENRIMFLGPLSNAAHPKHVLFHNGYNISSDMHIHLFFKERVDTDTFGSFVEALKMSCGGEGRSKAHDKYLQYITQVCLEAGLRILPGEAIAALERFDNITIPIIPIDECTFLFTEFCEYLVQPQTASNIFQNYIEPLKQITLEKSGVSGFDVKKLRPLDNVLTWLSITSYITLTPVLAHIQARVKELESNKDLIRLCDSDEGHSYPVPKISKILTPLKRDLHLIKTLLQGSWYKKALNFLAVPAAWSAIRIGFSLLGSSVVGASVWLGVDLLNRKRDWYKFNSYQKLRSNKTELTRAQKESFDIGLAAIDTRKQFLSLFESATWNHPREYYAAVAAKQLEDSTLKKNISEKKR